jgi:Flp pilus assembly protein TadG
MHKPQSIRSRRESGAVIFLVLIALVMLVAFGALVIDGSHIYAVNTKCQATADGAALAAAYELPDLVKAEAAAIDYGAKNMPVSDNGQVIQPDDVTFGKWNFSTRVFTPTVDPLEANAVRVTTNRSNDNGNPLPLTLGNALGFSTTNISRTATAAFGALGTWDLSLAQDVTGSFVNEIDEAKLADHGLLDCFSAGVDPRSTFGVISFTGHGQNLAPMLPIASGYPTLNTGINNIKDCSTGGPPCSGTDIAVGLEFALANLTNSSGLTPGAPQAIVLVTDGKPETSASGTHPWPTYTPAMLATLATQAADQVWSQGVSIFIVYYDGAHDPSNSAFLSTLVRGSGVFLSTPDPEKLPELLSSICGSIGPLRLVD